MYIDVLSVIYGKAVLTYKILETISMQKCKNNDFWSFYI